VSPGSPWQTIISPLATVMRLKRLARARKTPSGSANKTAARSSTATLAIISW
jgi:hypothetical protein